MWWSSFGYLKQKSLRHYHAAGPVVILGLAAAGIFFSRWLTDTLQKGLHQALESSNWTGAYSAEPGQSNGWNSLLIWAGSRADWLIEWGVILLVLWLKVKATKYLLITIMAPIMSALAADVKRAETGQVTPFVWSGLLRDILRGVRISTVLLLMELVLGFALWILGLTLAFFLGPLMIAVGPVLLTASWIVGAYFFGAAVYDAVYEQGGLDWKDSIRAGWKQRGHLLGLGAIFSVIMAIPWVGPYLAALLGPVPCTTAAARLYFRPRSIEPT
ncbi:EI24 domain-containing protein [bacterium]|nr:EI24 domain-containing protein [bacterium]